MIIRKSKEQIEYIVKTRSLGKLLAYFFPLLMGIPFLLFAISESYCIANTTQEDIAAIKPERVVQQWIAYNKKHSNDNVYLVTESGDSIVRGVHTPRFDKLREAVARNESLLVWHADLSPLGVLSYLYPQIRNNSTTLLQVASDKEMIIPFAAMKEKLEERMWFVWGFGLMFVVTIYIVILFTCAIVVKRRQGQ